MRIQQRPVTVLRKSDGSRWSPIEIAKVATHFNIATGTDPDNPEDLALLGTVSTEKVEEFLLTHEGFPKLEVLHLNCKVL